MKHRLLTVLVFLSFGFLGVILSGSVPVAREVANAGKATSKGGGAVPTLAIPTVSTIATSATFSSNITNTGGTAVTIEGFKYGISTVYGSVVSTSGSFGTGPYSLSATGFACGVIYHYQAYAVNSAGTGVSTPDQTFQMDPCNAPSSSFQISYLSTDANGVKSYTVTSGYNGDGQHVLRVLEPNNPAPGVSHNFLYVLPVEPELGTKYGDGLATLQALNAQNQYNVTIIAPSFKIFPWYADNVTNPNYRYEAFMALELRPWVTAHLTTSGAEQHWLLGFSKSGYGAIDLILKHPDLFTLGAFWDFPADMSSYTSYSANTNYGTQANFDNNYRLTGIFLENHKSPFLDDNRIWINGYGLFRTDVKDFDALLFSEGMQHTTAPEVSRAHNWTSGWVPSALVGLYTNSIAVPVIIDVSPGAPSPISATISWITNTPSDSQVNYGLDSSYTESTVLNTTATTNHSVVITGLTPDTTYHYRVRSTNYLGNLATSTDQTFTTPANL